MNRSCLKGVLLFITGCILFTWLSCAPENTSWVGQGYHNVGAHYNGYFYSREEIAKIEQTLVKGQDNDYNHVLKLFPSPDSAVALSYDKEAQEAIKMASLAIQRHPHSKWADDAYILVGKARLYTLDWGNAIQTFKYVNTKSKNPDARHLAIIHLIRTFVEHKEFNNAQSAIDFIQKEKLSKTNLKKFYLEKAYYHQMLNDYENMLKSLTTVDHLLKKKDRRGRIYFIIGQVYQKLGFESQAYAYYRKCLSTNPEYEVDFYARLYLAQVTEISKSHDVNAAHRSFKRLLNDSKNKEFKDKIYYEMGVFELKQKNLTQAITNLNLSVRTGTNKRIDGEAYLLMGKIYYDTLKNYELSQAYYDSAINALPNDYEDYAKIKKRAEVLNDFVKNLKTIQWQDSLLTLAHLDSTTLRGKVDSLVTAKLNAEKKKKSKKRNSNRIDIQSNNNNNVFNNETEEDQTTDNNASASNWYFANPSVMAIGATEFKRIWGDIVLQDNWRRSQRINDAIESDEVAFEDPSVPTADPSANLPKADPVDVEYDNLVKQLPKTEVQRKEALGKIENAYLALGDIYYYKLEEKANAVSWYKKLLKRFPESEYAPEVLYKIYLINKEIDPMDAAPYANILKQKYPNSTFAKILINPDYLKQNSEAAEKQKEYYRVAYQQFESGDNMIALQTLREAEALGQTVFTPNLELLKILIAGKTEDINKYQQLLGDFIKNNPDAEVTAYAKKLLESSREFQTTQQKQKTITYIRSFEESHYFVVVSKKDDKINEQVSAQLENFNDQYFKDLKLRTSSLVLNDAYMITFVSELPRISSALEYYKTFIDKLPNLTALRDRKFSTFVITKDNFDIFYRTKGLDEYVKFFEKNYHPENQ